MYGFDGITGFILNGENYYYKKNLQGDIIGIFDNNRQIIAKYDYDSWGNFKISYLDNGIFVDITEENSYNYSIASLYVALKNPFRYRGYYYDNETKLYYLNSRYYDPELGRFINIDDINVLTQSKDLLNGLNLYAYCSNNPVMLKDETGKAWWEWLIGIFVIAAAAVLTVVTAGGFAAAGAAFMGALGIGGSVGGAAGFFAAATIGATIGATVGGLVGGFSNVVMGGDFWSGFSNGFMWGAISGFISGGISSLNFGGKGFFGPAQQFNKWQVAAQLISNYGIYMMRNVINNDKPTFLGSLLSLFGGFAGGMMAYLKFPEQVFIVIGLEIEGLLTNIFKRIWKIPENNII